MNMLQFITHTNDRYDTIEGVSQVLKGGCKWIQLRMKDAGKSEILKTAVILKEMCWNYQATLLIDDHVDICLEADLDGVHLGKNDMDPVQAREILGPSKIIGGTANTFEDIEYLIKKVDYIGLGPFRFTRTKKQLSPILGLDGYSRIFEKCREKGYTLPVVAIGGIRKDDISAIRQTGANGIALSSAILSAVDPVREVREIITLLTDKRIEGNL
ncbi:MAG: thiamine phosphate synthase [Bacteroidales bacterium]